MNRRIMILCLAALPMGNALQGVTPDWTGGAQVPASMSLCVNYTLEPNAAASLQQKPLGGLTDAFRTSTINDFGVPCFEVLSPAAREDSPQPKRVRACRSFAGTVDVSQLPAGIVQVHSEARVGRVGYCIGGDTEDCREAVVAGAKPAAAADSVKPYVWYASFPSDGVSYVSSLSDEGARSAELIQLLASNKHRKEKIGVNAEITELDGSDPSKILLRDQAGLLILAGHDGFELADKTRSTPRPFLIAGRSGGLSVPSNAGGLTTIVFVSWPAPAPSVIAPAHAQK